MRFLDLCDKEVVDINECNCIGRIRDVEIDTACGAILSVIVPGPGRFFGIFGKEYEFCIPWVNIIKIGPDIVLVNLNEETMKKKLKC